MNLIADDRPAVLAAVCLDGFGTLFHLGDGSPARAVVRRLGELGYSGGVEPVAAGLRLEYPYYRARHKFVATPRQLELLQAECGQIVIDQLGPSGAGLAAPAVGRAIAQAFPPRLYPESIAAISRIKAAGLKVGVVSNFSYLLIATLRQLGIAEMFDFAVVSALCNFAKPDPRIFAIAAREAGCQQSRIAHIGNSHAEDYLGARSAGFSAVLLERSGPEHAGEQIASAGDLLSALDLLL